MSLLAVRESGPLAARQVETFLLAQGAAFDLSGDIALNTAHREIIAGNPHGTSKADLGLDNVTNDAQLKRAAGDFQAFAQKISPVGGDSLISEDSADGENKKRITLTGIYSWLKSLFSAIDYRNPIVLTGSIAPNNGDFFTTDSKLLTITGSGGEKFWPNGGATSRIIWGASSGAALPVEINPSSLGIGGVFEIAIDDGESRKIRYDGTDFVKIDGVEIPDEFGVYNSADQIGLSLDTFNAASLDSETYDTGVFSSGAFTPRRNAKWSLPARFPVKMAAGGAIGRSIARLYRTSADEVWGDVWPDETNTTNLPVRTTGTFNIDAVAGVAHTMEIFATGSGAASYTILGDGQTIGAALWGKETVPW